MTIVANVALILLPLYGAYDVPEKEKRNYQKNLIQWYMRRDTIVENLIKIFKEKTGRKSV